MDPSARTRRLRVWWTHCGSCRPLCHCDADCPAAQCCTDTVGATGLSVIDVPVFVPSFLVPQVPRQNDADDRTVAQLGVRVVNVLRRLGRPHEHAGVRSVLGSRPSDLGRRTPLFAFRPPLTQGRLRRERCMRRRPPAAARPGAPTRSARSPRRSTRPRPVPPACLCACGPLSTRGTPPVARARADLDPSPAR